MDANISLRDFLLFMQGAGVNVIAGVLLSYIVEWWPRWNELESRVKRLITFGLCMVIPLIATLGLVMLGYQPNSLEETWWMAIVSGAVAFGSSTLAHTRLLTASTK